MEKEKNTPKEIYEQFIAGEDYKRSIGERGIYEQSRMNERFYAGDQWHGVNAGNTRPLVRRNIIKRIGEYKISSVCASPVKVRFVADGAPTPDMMKEEMEGITELLSDYVETTKERLRFDNVLEDAVREAFISGTAFLYTYWDNEVPTGMFADEYCKVSVYGDVKSQVLSGVNVVLGDPNDKDVQAQPYVIISQRRTLSSVRAEAEANGLDATLIASDESTRFNAGDRGAAEPDGGIRVTVLTKLYKVRENGKVHVKGIRVTEKATVRGEWDLGISVYPLSRFSWLERSSSAYGDSEVTYLIPNQIAINRALSAAVWSAMITGMPKTVVNGDLIDEPVNNDPGQIITISAGSDYDVQRAISYLHPPQFASQIQAVVRDVAESTLADSGANEVALGDIRPDNAAAIIAMREAALQPMQCYRNRFYTFVEDIARVWAEFWLNMYGKRTVKAGGKLVEVDFDRYKSLILSVRVDVGASTLWGETVTVSSLDNLFAKGVIDAKEYLARLPKGTIPDRDGLITREDTIRRFRELYPEESKKFDMLTDEEKEKLLNESEGKL